MTSSFTHCDLVSTGTMQWILFAIITHFVALCFAQSPGLECDRNITVSRNTGSQIVRSKVVNVANRIFSSGLPSEASDKALYGALISGYSEMESDMGLTIFQTAQMEITEQYFLACNGPEDQRPSVSDINFHIQQFVAVLETSPLDISALRKQFGILTCQEQMSYSNPDCATVDCSGGLENTTTVSTFFCCLQASHVRELFGIISQVATLNNSVPCLAFVVDTTGSMSAEIARVRTLVHGFVNPADPVCYILVDFNDIGKIVDNSVFLRAVFDPSGTLDGGTLNEFTTAVDNLDAHDGDDCPEFGMIGLLLALDQIRELHPIAASRSQIILVTDASAINDYLYTDVISNATALGVTVHELLSGSGCSGPGFGNYTTIANATGGIQVYNLDDFDVITRFVQTTLVSGGFQGNSMFGPALPSHTVQVSKFTTVLKVLIRTTQPQVTIAGPNGTVESLTVPQNLVLYNNENPLPGNYTFSVAFSTLEITIDVLVLLDLFVSYIMDDPGSGGTLPVQEPLSCTQGQVSASTSRLSDIDLTFPVYLAIVNATGGVTDEVQLVPCDNMLISDNFLMFPPETFRYQLRGHDSNGVPFTFTSPVQINLQPPIANTTVVGSNGLFLNSNTRTVSTLLQHNLIGNTLFIGATGSDGLTLNSTTDKIIVPSGGIFTVTFAVSVPSTLNIAFINITIQDSCSTTTQTISLSAIIRAAPPIQFPPTVHISGGSCSSEEGETYRHEIDEKVQMILRGKLSQEGG